jgi:hypothetical protein
MRFEFNFYDKMWKADERSEKKKYELLQKKIYMNTKKKDSKKTAFFCLGLESKH